MSKETKQERPGRPSAEQPMSVFSLYCPSEAQAKFRRLAAEQGVTMGQMLEYLLKDYK